MSNPLKLFAIASLLLSSTALAQTARAIPIASPGETYTPGSQYTATFEQTRNTWRLQPANGQDVVIDAGACATGAMVPAGVWLLVVGDQGRPELLAPSVTRLPSGSPDRVALRSCEQAKGHDLAVPTAVLELLVANTGAIYVTN